MSANLITTALCSDGVTRSIYWRDKVGECILVDGEYHRRGWRGITW